MKGDARDTITSIDDRGDRGSQTFISDLRVREAFARRNGSSTLPCEIRSMVEHPSSAAWTRKRRSLVTKKFFEKSRQGPKLASQ